jgi:hypothetical protein
MKTSLSSYLDLFYFDSIILFCERFLLLEGCFYLEVELGIGIFVLGWIDGRVMR